VANEEHAELVPPPPLPPRLVDITPIILGGTVLWFALFLGTLIWRYALDGGNPLLLWTSLCGWVLGLLGYTVVRWQRSAARRGRRGAQIGL
jgi:hypothetical protein